MSSSSRSKPTLAHRAQYVGFRASLLLVRVIPEAVALVLGELAGWLGGVVFRLRRQVVADNLARAFPERNAAWRRKVAWRAYRHLGREAVAAFLLGDMGPEEVRRRTELIGYEALRVAHARGKGLIVLTGHLGNWEIAGACLAVRGHSLDAVAFAQHNRLLDEELTRTRARLGMHIVHAGGTPKKLTRTLQEGRVVGLVMDQNVRSGGVFVDFFGVPASTAPGPVFLALRTGAPIFIGTAFRKPGWRARYRVVMEEVPVEATDDVDADVARITQDHQRRLQRYVEEAPEQYLWSHRRWKTRPAKAEPTPKVGL